MVKSTNMEDYTLTTSSNTDDISYYTPCYNSDNFSLGLIKDVLEDYEYLKTEENMKKRLYQYAVILHKFKDIAGTTTSGSKEYDDSEMIIQPTYIIARNEKDLVFKVTRLIPDAHAENPDNVEILIRPF